MSEQTLAQWLQRLEQLHPEEIELGLERVAEVAARLNLQRFNCPVISVAGTNGKGTTVASLAALLEHAQWRVGVYTSPHLFKFNERISINGTNVSDAALVASFSRIDVVRAEVPLTYFEFATLAALELFQRADLDAIILEVGLGGRLDAVNIIDADIAIVTTIALDHESWLGSDRETIAIEKAGILRPGQTFICADLNPPKSLQRRADELGCVSHYVTESQAFGVAEGLSLRGENIAAAREAGRVLGVEHSAAGTNSIMQQLNMLGRVQNLSCGNRHCIVDVAHNPAAVSNLAQHLRETKTEGRTIAVFAALSDKNIRAMIRSIQTQVDGWFIADLPNVARACSAAELNALLREEGVSMISRSDNPRQAYRRATSAVGAGDRIVIFGSFHTVAAVLPSIDKDRKRLE